MRSEVVGGHGGDTLGVYQPSHRPKAGKRGRFSLLQPSHSRPAIVPAIASRAWGQVMAPSLTFSEAAETPRWELRRGKPAYARSYGAASWGWFRG